MVFGKRKRAEEANTPRVIDLIFAPVWLDVSSLAHIISEADLLFVWGQVFNFKASSVCPIFLAARPRLLILALRSLEGDFPNCFGYND